MRTARPKANPVLANWDWLYSHPTKAELALEPEVAKLGIPYRFQHRVWNFVVDFALPTLMVAIEVDDPSHNRADKRRKDAERTEWLVGRGWRVVRTTNAEAIADPAAALIRALGPLQEFKEPDTCLPF